MDEYTRKAKIKSLISALCTEIFNVFQLPVIDATTDLNDVIKQLSGSICYSKNNDYQIYKTSDNTFLIELPVNHDKKQATWYIAQQLGTLFLHMGFQTNPMCWTQIPLHKPYECNTLEDQEQSNLFAGFFLMPKHEFKRIMDMYSEGSTVHTEKIAEHFGVQISTAHWWGVTLGYLKPDFS